MIAPFLPPQKLKDLSLDGAQTVGFPCVGVLSFLVVFVSNVLLALAVKPCNAPRACLTERCRKTCVTANGCAIDRLSIGIMKRWFGRRNAVAQLKVSAGDVA